MPGAKGGFLPFHSFTCAAAAESEGGADLVHEMILYLRLLSKWLFHSSSFSGQALKSLLTPLFLLYLTANASENPANPTLYLESHAFLSRPWSPPSPSHYHPPHYGNGLPGGAQLPLTPTSTVFSNNSWSSSFKI